MKNLLAVFFACAMCFAVIGCGGGDDGTDATDSTPDPATEDLNEEETAEEEEANAAGEGAEEE